MATAGEYEAAFERERENHYPAVDAFEAQMGHALDRRRLEEAARVLACPVKKNPPNWQHGRVLYAAARAYLKRGPVTILDIGTAKGFSALCLFWAIWDAGISARIVSVDVLDPQKPSYRNSILDLSGPKTLADYLQPWLESWSEAAGIEFLGITGADWLHASEGRIQFAFIDGKHNFEAVSQEAALLAQRQEQGDVIVFDDLQMEPVRRAVDAITGYSIQRIEASESRQYAMAVKQ